MPLQIRMMTSKSLAEEKSRSERRDTMLPTDLAKPMGILNGTKVGGTRKLPTARFSECVSYRLDEDGNKVNAHIFKPNERKHNRRNISKEDREQAHLHILEAQQHIVRMREAAGTLNIGRDFS